jgi:hypothetical protein
MAQGIYSCTVTGKLGGIIQIRQDVRHRGYPTGAGAKPGNSSRADMVGGEQFRGAFCRQAPHPGCSAASASPAANVVCPPGRILPKRFSLRDKEANTPVTYGRHLNGVQLLVRPSSAGFKWVDCEQLPVRRRYASTWSARGPSTRRSTYQPRECKRRLPPSGKPFR